ncbi:MAG: hypothetical protein COA96_10420, partial [SAR86 cluster bacterium]
MVDQLVSQPEHGETIIQDGKASPSMQLFLDELAQKINGQLLGPALQMTSYTVDGVPNASSWEAAMIYVSDESGGSVPAFSDGFAWRRCTDRA